MHGLNVSSFRQLTSRSAVGPGDGSIDAADRRLSVAVVAGLRAHFDVR